MLILLTLTLGILLKWSSLGFNELYITLGNKRFIVSYRGLNKSHNKLFRLCARSGSSYCYYYLPHYRQVNPSSLPPAATTTITTPTNLLTKHRAWALVIMSIPTFSWERGRRKTAYALHQIVNAQPSMRRSESSPTSSRPSPVREDPPPEELGNVSSLSPRVIRMRRKSRLKKFISVDFCWLSEHI